MTISFVNVDAWGKSIEEKTHSLERVQAVYAASNSWSYKAGTGTRWSDAQSVRGVVRIHATTGLHGKEIEQLAMQREKKGNLVREDRAAGESTSPGFTLA